MAQPEGGTTGSAESSAGSAAAVRYHRQYGAGDVNGDGQQDVLSVEADGPYDEHGPARAVARSGRDGTGLWSRAMAHDGEWVAAVRRDLTGDGLDDLVHRAYEFRGFQIGTSCESGICTTRSSSSFGMDEAVVSGADAGTVSARRTTSEAGSTTVKGTSSSATGGTSRDDRTTSTRSEPEARLLAWPGSPGGAALLTTVVEARRDIEVRVDTEAVVRVTHTAADRHRWRTSARVTRSDGTVLSEWADPQDDTGIAVTPLWDVDGDGRTELLARTTQVTDAVRTRDCVVVAGTEVRCQEQSQVSSREDRLAVLDAATGATRWSVPVDGSTGLYRLNGDADGDGAEDLLRVDRQPDGTVLHQVLSSRDGAPRSPAVPYRGELRAAGLDGRVLIASSVDCEGFTVVRLDLATGSAETGPEHTYSGACNIVLGIGAANGVPDVDGDGVSDVVYGATRGGGQGPVSVLAFASGRDGSLIRDSIVDGFSSPYLVPDVDGDGVVDLLTSDDYRDEGHVSLQSGRTGARLWSVPIGRETFAQPVLDSVRLSGVLLTTFEQAPVLLEPATGTERWRVE